MAGPPRRRHPGGGGRSRPWRRTARATAPLPPEQLGVVAQRLLPTERGHHPDRAQVELAFEPTGRVDAPVGQSGGEPLHGGLLRLGQAGPVHGQVPAQVPARRPRPRARPVEQDRAGVGAAAEVAHLPVAMQERRRRGGQGFGQDRRVGLDGGGDVGEPRGPLGQARPTGGRRRDRPRRVGDGQLAASRSRRRRAAGVASSSSAGHRRRTTSRTARTARRGPPRSGHAGGAARRRRLPARGGRRRHASRL